MNYMLHLLYCCHCNSHILYSQSFLFNRINVALGNNKYFSVLDELPTPIRQTKELIQDNYHLQQPPYH